MTRLQNMGIWETQLEKTVICSVAVVRRSERVSVCQSVIGFKVTVLRTCGWW